MKKNNRNNSHNLENKMDTNYLIYRQISLKNKCIQDYQEI